MTLKAKEKIADKVDREPFGYSFGSTFMNARFPAWECVKHIKNSLDSTRGAFYSRKHSNWIINNNSSGLDIVNLINFILGNPYSGVEFYLADLNIDNILNIQDIIILINIIINC